MMRVMVIVRNGVSAIVADVTARLHVMGARPHLVVRRQTGVPLASSTLEHISPVNIIPFLFICFAVRVLHT